MIGLISVIDVELRGIRRLNAGRIRGLYYARKREDRITIEWGTKNAVLKMGIKI